MEQDLDRDKSRLAMMEEQVSFLRERVEASARKDEFLNRLIEGLIDKGLGSEIADLIKARGMKNDLLRLRERPGLSVSFEVDGQS